MPRAATKRRILVALSEGELKYTLEAINHQLNEPAPHLTGAQARRCLAGAHGQLANAVEFTESEFMALTSELAPAMRPCYLRDLNPAISNTIKRAIEKLRRLMQWM